MLPVSMLVVACSAPDRLVFLSRSSVGVDIDTAPPTASIGIDRSEAVIAPVYENGETPPVIAGFRYADNGLLSGHAGSAFAAGDAAAAMSALYDREAPAEKSIKRFDHPIVLSSRPETAAESDEPSRVRTLVFGTTSTIGLKASWSGVNAPLPDAFHFGLHRKEFAWAPVTTRAVVSESGEINHHVKAPSLLATVDVARDAASLPGTNLESVQYFATGTAATMLAQEKQVRKAMLVRLDPNAPKLAAAHRFQESSEAREAVEAWLDQPGKEVARRASLRGWLQSRGIELSPTTWLFQAGAAELSHAIHDLIEPTNE